MQPEGDAKAVHFSGLSALPPTFGVNVFLAFFGGFWSGSDARRIMVACFTVFTQIDTANVKVARDAPVDWRVCAPALWRPRAWTRSA